jgi:hypothetical protein
MVRVFNRLLIGATVFLFVIGLGAFGAGVMVYDRSPIETVLAIFVIGGILYLFGEAWERT